jgi:hypothetical protein
MASSPRKLVAIFAVAALVGLISACTKQPATTSESSEPTANAHAWKVLDGDLLILEVTDTPGPIVSTAALPPGVPVRRHPFLSASARSARHENELHKHLEASTTLPDFLGRLRGAGYKVIPVAP